MQSTATAVTRHALVAESESTMWMMTCFTLTYHEDLKILIREGIAKLCPPGIVAREYDSLQSVLSPGELGTQGCYLLVGLSSSSSVHLRLIDIFLYRPDAP